MPQSSLFSKLGPDPNSVYECLRRSNDPKAIEARNFTDQLWQIFRPYADNNFEAELRVEFLSRFREMYLTCTLLEKKFSISCLKPGPDILIQDTMQSIWIEAVAPDQGEVASDRVPDRTGTA